MFSAGVMVAKGLDVRFDSGKDVLNAYWGYLSGGGLVIPDQSDFEVGQSVSLTVWVESLQSSFSLAGRIVRRDTRGGQAVVAFAPGEPHDLLLAEALAEAENVPARRHRRYRIDERVRLRPVVASTPLAAGTMTDAPLPPPDVDASLVDLSAEGCCVRLDGEAPGVLPVGTAIDVVLDGPVLSGVVVWVRNRERGVAFPSETSSLLSEYIERKLQG